MYILVDEKIASLRARGFFKSHLKEEKEEALGMFKY